MSHGLDYLHSHSAMERELRFPKHTVLVDLKFRDLFDSERIEDFTVKHDGKTYDFIKVPVLDFVKMNGVFKNLMH